MKYKWRFKHNKVPIPKGMRSYDFIEWAEKNHPELTTEFKKNHKYISKKEPMKEKKMNTFKMDTSADIEILFMNFKEVLKEKNRRYGNSALKPFHVFSRTAPSTQICNRIDDKLGRIKTSQELKKNEVCDLFGYLALLMIERGWTEFDDLLD